MDTMQLEEYIKTEVGRRLTHDNVYDVLVTAGWDRKIVIQSFIAIFGEKINLSVLKLEGVEILIEKSFKLYFSHFWLYYLLSIIPFFLTVFISLSTSLLLTPMLLLLPKYPLSLLWSLPVYLLIAFLTGLIHICFNAVLIYSLVNHNNMIDLKQTLSHCWSRLYKFWLLTTIASIFIAFGGIFLIVPGIFLFISLSFVSYIFFDENLNGISAIKKSYHYVKGYWWPIFGRILIFGLGFSIISIIYEQVFRIFKISTVISILLVIFSLAIIPIYPIFMFLIYKKIKEIKYFFYLS